MFKKCTVCNNSFSPKHKDTIMCSQKCRYKHSNDLRPRKTSKSYIKASALKKNSIPQLHKELILGTLLGDACLVRQTDNFHRLSLCHSDKQLDYLLCKRKILDSIFLQSNPNKYITREGHTQYHFHSVSHPDLTNIYGLFYRNGRKQVTRRLLNFFSPTSLLFWYLDDGSLIKSSGNSIIFCTDSFSLSEVKTLKIFLWQKFKIKSSILSSWGTFGNKFYNRLRLVKSDSNLFFNLIKQSPFYPLIPENIRYKIVKNA